MNLGRAWTRELFQASGAALLAPGAVVASLAVLALAGGFAQLGTLGEVFAGPSLQTLPRAARIAASRSARRTSPVLIALAAQPTRGAAGAGVAPARSGAGSGSGTRPSGGGAGSFQQGGPTPGGTGGQGGHGGPGPGSPGPGSPGPGSPGAGSPPPPGRPPVPPPTLLDGVVSLGASVTGQVPGPVGSLATHTLQSAGHTLDGILSPPPGGGAPSAVRGVL